MRGGEERRDIDEERQCIEERRNVNALSINALRRSLRGEGRGEGGTYRGGT